MLGRATFSNQITLRLKILLINLLTLPKYFLSFKKEDSCVSNGTIMESRDKVSFFSNMKIRKVCNF